MDEETRNKNKDTKDDTDESDKSFDQAVEEATGWEEATGGEEAGESANTMHYLLIGLAVVILLLNIYSIAQINDLGGKISSLNKVTGMAVSNTSTQPSETSPITIATIQKTVPTTTLATSSQPVNIIVLSDKRCADCNFVDDVITQLSDVFPGMTSTRLDYSTPEGKKLYTDAQLRYLPAVLFSADVKNDKNYSAIQQYLEPAGQYQSLRIGSQYDPTCYKDDGTPDCSKCGNMTECRNETKKDLQVFVMSDCPYGKQAIQALKQVADNFGDSITYDVHYIANENGGAFTSLHGQYEVDEDIVQLCVKTYSPDEWLDYINCRSTNGVKDIDWHICANEAGITSIAVKTVEKCVNGSKGKQLLATDIQLAQALSINSSPTWLANNRYEFNAIDAETVKQNFCKYNPGIPGCDVTLNTSTGGLSPTGGCAG